MGKNSYIIIWKDESLWKNIRNISIFLGSLTLLVMGLDQEIFRSYYSLVYFLLFCIFTIADTLVQNINKEIHEIKRYLFWRSFFLVIFFALLYSTAFFTSNDYTAIIIFVTFLVLISIGEAFKDKIRKSNYVIKYLYDDNPPFLSKRYFEETENFKIVLTIIVLVIFFTGFVLSVCGIYLHWDWVNIKTKP